MFPTLSKKKSWGKKEGAKRKEEQNREGAKVTTNGFATQHRTMIATFRVNYLPCYHAFIWASHESSFPFCCVLWCVRRRMCFPVLASAVFLAALCGVGADGADVGADGACGFVAHYPYQYVAYKTPEPPTIDGKLDEPLWQDVAWTRDFLDISGSKQTHTHTNTHTNTHKHTQTQTHTKTAHKHTNIQTHTLSLTQN